MRICIAAGGTGGHLLPGLATAAELRSRGHRVHFLVRKDRDSQAVLAKEGFPSSAFAYQGFPRRLSAQWLTFPFLSLTACSAARRVLRREAPDAVLGMGGYVSVPVGLAAVRLGIPLVVHEQNRSAGLANRLLSRWARGVAVSFQGTRGFPPSVPLAFTGLPLRPGLAGKDPAAARRELGLDPDAFTLLIFGGSQGARALNRCAAESLRKWGKPRREWQVVHFTGAADAEWAERFYREAGCRAFVRPYWSDMATAYGAADFVVCRAGANTVMELARLGKAALLVPYPHATNAHQEENARFLEERGQARVILEKDLTEEQFLSVLDGLPAPASLREASFRRMQNPPAECSQGAAHLADLLEQVAMARA